MWERRKWVDAFEKNRTEDGIWRCVPAEDDSRDCSSIEQKKGLRKSGRGGKIETVRVGVIGERRSNGLSCDDYKSTNGDWIVDEQKKKGREIRIETESVSRCKRSVSQGETRRTECRNQWWMLVRMYGRTGISKIRHREYQSSRTEWRRDIARAERHEAADGDNLKQNIKSHSSVTCEPQELEWKEAKKEGGKTNSPRFRLPKLEQ